MATIQPGIAPHDLLSYAATASPGYGANSRSARTSRIAPKVKPRFLSTNRAFGVNAQGMSETPTLPEDCTDMYQVRAGVDAIDRELIDLIDRRFGYMRAAARIKQSRDEVRDEARKAEVIANVRKAALAHGLPEEKITELWGLLVESSIAYELLEWDRYRSS